MNPCCCILVPQSSLCGVGYPKWRNGMASGSGIDQEARNDHISLPKMYPR